MPDPPPLSGAGDVGIRCVDRAPPGSDAAVPPPGVLDCAADDGDAVDLRSQRWGRHTITWRPPGSKGNKLGQRSALCKVHTRSGCRCTRSINCSVENPPQVAFRKLAYWLNTAGDHAAVWDHMAVPPSFLPVVAWADLVASRS